MVQPKSKLPWRISEVSLDVLRDSKNEFVLSSSINNKQDLAYTVKACNNYPKAIELLKEALDQLESMVEEETFTKRRIQEFLKQTQND